MKLWTFWGVTQTHSVIHSSQNWYHSLFVAVLTKCSVAVLVATSAHLGKARLVAVLTIRVWPCGFPPHDSIMREENHLTTGLWAHNPNLMKICILLLCEKWWSGQVTILHIFWQLRCHDMCKIVIWLDHKNKKSRNSCHKISIMSSDTICEAGGCHPWPSVWVAIPAPWTPHMVDSGARHGALSHWPLGDLNAILKMEFSILFYWLVSSDLLVIMPSDECHRILLMISQHWFR